MYPLANKYSTGTLLPNSLMVISTEWYTYKVYCTECTLNKAYIHRVQSVLQVDLPNPFQTGKRQVSFDGRRQLQNVINTLGALQAQTYQHAMYTVTTASTDTDTQSCNQSHSVTDMMQCQLHSKVDQWRCSMKTYHHHHTLQTGTRSRPAHLRHRSYSCPAERLPCVHRHAPVT